MEDSANRTVRLKVSPAVARLVGKQSSREMHLLAARGEVPLSGGELLTALFFLVHGGDAEIRSLALATLRELPPAVLTPPITDPQLSSRLLDMVARVRLAELAVMEPLLTNPALTDETLAWVGARASGGVLSLVANNDQRLRQSPQIVEAILGNPHAERALKYRLGWQEPVPEPESAAAADTPSLQEEEAAEGEGSDGDPAEPQAQAEEEGNLSKYQMSMEMAVAEKIKMAMTGDKEWRTLFLKDANKLVSSAALKNPRITEGEVLTVAKNKSSSDELIRLITLNREWLKNYEIKRALVYHPRTPLPKALRFMNTLGEKDIKNIAKSRGIAQVLVNNARRMLMNLEKKK